MCFVIVRNIVSINHLTLLHLLHAYHHIFLVTEAMTTEMENAIVFLFHSYNNSQNIDQTSVSTIIGINNVDLWHFDEELCFTRTCPNIHVYQVCCSDSSFQVIHDHKYNAVNKVTGVVVNLIYMCHKYVISVNVMNEVITSIWNYYPSNVS